MHSRRLFTANNISLHYRDNESAGAPPLLLLHSLSDNTYAFDAIIRAGLDTHFRLIVPDMRGRGDSSRPPTGYTLDDHCADIIALLDHLGLEQVYIAGHSFGGLLGLYFSAHYADRVTGLVMIDAAAEMNPLTPLILLMISDRLGKWYSSPDAYIMNLRAAPFITHWDEDLRTTFMADADMLPDGSLIVKTQKQHIAQCSADVFRIQKHDWRQYAIGFGGKALVLSATEPFIKGQHILPVQKAVETSVLFPKGAHEVVSGNHMTMLFGPGAKDIAKHIIARFTAAPARRRVRNQASLMPA